MKRVLPPLSILFAIFIAGCRSTSGGNTQIKGQLAPLPDTCPWSVATSYEQLKTLGLYEYDLPNSTFAPSVYLAKNLSKAQVLADLSCVRLLFTHVFSATDYFRDIVDVDLVERLDELRANVAEAGGDATNFMSRQDLANKVVALHQGTVDRHVWYSFSPQENNANTVNSGFSVNPSHPAFVFVAEKLVKQDAMIYRATEIESGKDLTQCGSLTVVKLLSSSPKDVTFAGYIDGVGQMTVDCTRSDGSHVALALNSKDNLITGPTIAETAAGATLTTTPDGIDILRIASFPVPMTDAQKLIVKTLSTTDHPLIIDLRGEPGGEVAFEQALEDALFASSETYETSTKTSIWSLATMLGVTQVYRDAIENIKTSSMSDTQKATDIVQAEAIFEHWESGITPMVASFNLQSMTDRRIETETNTATGRRATPRTAPVVILIDRGCVSQCEAFLGAARKLPGAQGHILGTPSAGGLVFSSLGFYYLPHSRIKAPMSIARTDFLPAVTEGQGFQPDHYILGGDARTAGVCYMQTLLGKSCTITPEIAALPAPITLPQATEPQNLGLESCTGGTSTPAGWKFPSPGYSISCDQHAPHSGAYSATITSGVNPTSIGNVVQCIRADHLIGNIDYSAYMRTQITAGGTATLWLSITDAFGELLAFNNMGNDAVSGATNWTQHHILITAPANAAMICFGAYLSGAGSISVDDFMINVAAVPQ